MTPASMQISATRYCAMGSPPHQRVVLAASLLRCIACCFVGHQVGEKMCACLLVLACTNCPDVVRVVMFVVTAAPVAMLVKGWDLTQAASISSAAAVAAGHLGMMAVCAKNFDGQRWPTSSSPSRRITLRVTSLCDATELLFPSTYVRIERAGVRRCEHLVLYTGGWECLWAATALHSLSPHEVSAH